MNKWIKKHGFIIICQHEKNNQCKLTLANLNKKLEK